MDMREPTVIKRYARSRLYDTAANRYVTSDELRGRKEPFKVIDVETGDDVTQVLLA
jgi:polyhydroxyalkanoate synthesis regulator protein